MKVDMNYSLMEGRPLLLRQIAGHPTQRPSFTLSTNRNKKKMPKHMFPSSEDDTRGFQNIERNSDGSNGDKSIV